jgi:hypothetical protein
MYTSASGKADLRPSRATAWVGWIIFTALMMILSGLFDVLWGVLALTRDEVFVVGPGGNVLDVDYSTWGWVKLLVGAVVICVGLALPTGAQWAAIATVLLAMVSAVVALLSIAAFPVWSVLVIALDVSVIYAVTVHGHELRSP